MSAKQQQRPGDDLHDMHLEQARERFLSEGNIDYLQQHKWIADVYDVSVTEEMRVIQVIFEIDHIPEYFFAAGEFAVREVYATTTGKGLIGKLFGRETARKFYRGRTVLGATVEVDT